ncbi:MULTISPECIES: helicase-exonuclease AddAB subunit AddB [unclassified Cytobacillus]|uniref:helicase-exonuclease AddAB subunit AddB n=1 Tax=unclassified Cytobacillus TaxID=2675268 RepID=UPI001358D11F|nr:helicase-exonuclease AddAB subunit AddB [Cytobacillus sp. AMY 15.2]KAF0818045.1 ATP-dependent helicase/nuclease AddAB, subunit B [Bacillus sp. ZZV12-4809]MCM3092375.1 helicase-exonuclease AddAB subunit AddB [Cytobacillus sp. AMY 15.2]
MTVRLLIGRSGSGKTEYCLNEIRDELRFNPDGDPIIYLVPEQMTFLSEYKLITTPGLGGMIRSQVYSFTRLAWRILQETGGMSRYHLNSVGINMLIRKIIEDKKDELKLFQRAADKNGFIQQVEQIMTEFKRYCVNPDELAERQNQLSEYGNANKALQDKLHDLEVIYKKFEESLSGKYTDSEDYFRLLAEKASHSEYLRNAEVYIDGFYSFTPQEYAIVEQMMKQCRNVTITLTLDQPHSDASDELHLFRMPGENYQTIKEMTSRNMLDVEEILLSEQKRWSIPSLKHLEAHFDSRPAEPFSGEADIHIGQAVNRRAEIEGLARKINKLVRTEGYRYRDIAVLARNGHEYHDIIETVFRDYDIPFFIDQKRTMMNHPLVELIRSTLEIINGNWRYEPIFRAVKTELIFPSRISPGKLREQMDRLENYVLAYGIQGDKWTKKKRWTYRRIRGLEFEAVAQTDAEKKVEDELNDLREMITGPILRLHRRLRKALDGRGLCEALFLYMEELDVPVKIEKWKTVQEEKGNLVKSREHGQAWNSIMELLDQYVEMLGDEEVTLKRFASILDAGLESLRFTLVPPAIDQVMAADLERSRLTDIKAAFVIGLNEGVLPGKFAEDGVLADDDREILNTSGMKLAPGSRTRLLDEDFIAYKAFVTPSEKLFISYPLANEEGKALMPSPYIKRLGDLFPDCRHHSFMTDPAELPETEQLEYADNLNTALSYLTSQLQLKKRSYPIYDLWWDVYNFYLKNEQWRRPALKVLSSLNYENRTLQLGGEVSKELYGDHIQASVSRMELFHSCPFSHFAQHGLRLRERQVYRLEAPDIGDLFHAALKFIAETVMTQKLSWTDMTREQCEILAKEAVEMLAPKLQNEILLSSNRHHYIKRKLEQIISRASYVISEHAKSSGFSPVGLELGFGPKGELPSLAFPLKNGAKMELVGRIDRVDKAQDANGTFLRVIDYKSSSKDLNVSEVYYGIALQMLTYLDIIIAHSSSLIGTKADPAGVLYFHVHNPIVSTSKMLTLEDIEQELYKKFKMNGLLLGDENVIRLMDQTLETGDSSIISAGFKKDGTLSKRSKVASKQEFDYLRSYVRKMYRNTGNKITEGNVEIAPYKMKEKTPCTFCAYKSVCQFDESLETNDYRLFTPKPKEDMIEIIKKEVEGDENGDTA